MTILHLSVLAFAALIIGRLKKSRELVLLAASVFVIYWLQPPQQFVSLIFWLPTATLALTIFIWGMIVPSEMRSWKQNWRAGFVIASVVLLLDLNQFFNLEKIYITATPRLWMIALFLILYSIFGFVVFVKGVWKKQSSIKAVNYFSAIVIVSIILLFVYLKSPFLVAKSFNLIYSIRGQEVNDTRYIFSWLGFSYIAFRLIHTIRDYQSGRPPALTLSEYVNYVIFFPAFTSGPIDRAERFVQELRNPVALAEQGWVNAGSRFFIGLFKKFVIADTLVLFAMNDVFAVQAKSAGWMWFYLYAYSLRIYFDFSGYTDVAIGLARMMGIRLPENFSSPYLKPNLAQFWNSWHMTLTQWFRAYFFNPLTRSLRTKGFSAWLIILSTQVSTMILIGLWHGLSLGFVLWGLWHGLGLFVQNRWSEFIRSRMKTPFPAQGQLLLSAMGIFLTFNFVSLGWLFFTLSTPALAWQVMLKLFGIS
jgi:D-alanyl-lipoteichoic acid acyltransferase DltB (MBOAT superfamily)